MSSLLDRIQATTIEGQTSVTKMKIQTTVMNIMVATKTAIIKYTTILTQTKKMLTQEIVHWIIADQVKA